MCYPRQYHRGNPGSTKEEHNLLVFRFLFFSLMAAAVLQALPQTFAAADFSFLLCVAITLFCSSVEVLLKLNEGTFKDSAAIRVAFFFDVFLVIPAFVFTASHLQHYSESIVRLGKKLNAPSADLVAILAEPAELERISWWFCSTFLILLCRGLCDRLKFKKRPTLKSNPWPWIIAQSWGIAVSAIAALLCRKAEKDLFTGESKSPSEAYSRILGLAPNSESVEISSSCFGWITTLSVGSVLLMIAYLLYYYGHIRIRSESTQHD